MSTINSSFLNYNSLFTGSVSSGYSNDKNIYDVIQSYSQSSSQAYGKNISKYTEAQAESIINFKNYAASLMKSVGSLSAKQNDGSTLFGVYKASSSDTSALSVNYKSDVDKYSHEALAARRTPNYKPQAPSSFEVSISQLAEKQKNTSALNASEKTELTVGTHKFEISSGDSKLNYSINVTNEDTNESVQKKIAQAINKDEDSTVKASVYKSDGQSFLSIESNKTGESNGFVISDSGGSGAIAATGAGNVTQAAKNAVYSIDNGPVMTSESNDIEINSRTSITLNKVADNVKVDFKKDTLKGVNAARELVNNFNALYELAGENSGNNRSSLLLNQLSGLAQTYSKQLYEVGISRDENGYLTIDEEKMNSAAENGTLESLFSSDYGGSSYGFTNKLENIAKSVNDNPTQYVGKATRIEDGETKSKNFWEELNSGSASYSKLYFNMQKYENIGALFSGMF